MRLSAAGSLIASIGLLVAIALFLADRIDLDKMLDLMRKTDLRIAALSALCIWLSVPLNSLRLAKVLEWVSEIVPSYWTMLRVTSVGSFIAVVAPLAVLGDVAKIAVMRPLAGVQIGLAARSIIYDRVAAAIFLAIFGAVLVPVHLILGINARTVLLEAVILFGLLVACAVLLALARGALSVRHAALRDAIKAVYGATALLRGRSRVTAQIGFAGMNALLSALSIWLLAVAMGLPLTLASIVIFVPFVMILQNLPFLYLGWGGRELAIVSTFGALGTITVSDSLALSIEMGLMTFLAMIPNGLFLLGRWRRQRVSAVSGVEDVTAERAP